MSNHFDSHSQIVSGASNLECTQEQPHFLVKVNTKIDWRLVVSVLNDRFPDEQEFPTSLLLMLKMILLGQWYMLPDMDVESECRKEGPYRHFLEIGMEATVPDWIAVARFKKRLLSDHAARCLLNSISNHLAKNNL